MKCLSVHVSTFFLNTYERPVSVTGVGRYVVKVGAEPDDTLEGYEDAFAS